MHVQQSAQTITNTQHTHAHSENEENVVLSRNASQIGMHHVTLQWVLHFIIFPVHRVNEVRRAFHENVLQRGEDGRRKILIYSVLTSSTRRKSIRQFSGTKWNLPRSTFFRRCTVTTALADWQFSRATAAADGILAAVRCKSRCATTDESN